MSPIAQDRTLAQQLSAAFIVFGALVAGAFLATAVMHGVIWGWLTPEFERSQLAMKAENAAHSAMVDQEDSLRGYLLTRDVRFLEFYAHGEAALARANQALNAHLVSVPSAELAAAMVVKRLAEERWRDQWAKAAADTRSNVVAPSISEGAALFDAYRTAQATFASSLNRYGNRLSEREHHLVVVRVAFQLLVFLAVLFLIMRQHHALRAAIVNPVAALLRHIRRIRDGQLEVTADPVGPRDLAELAQGLNEMVRAIATARQIAESRDEALRNHSSRLRQILEASREFSESLNLKYVIGAVRKSTAAVGGYARVIVWLVDDEQKRLVESNESASIAPLDDSVELWHGVAGRAAKSGRMTFEDPAGQVRFGDSTSAPVRAIAIPLIVGARVVGALEGRHSEPQVATKEVVEIIELLATHAGTAIESARLHAVVEERSQFDALTRLLNRRRLDEDLDAECKRCTRYGRPMALVMLDVDHFKAYNDSHGHPKADKALQEVAEVVASCVRTTDTAYRYGGEEFCILLRETSGQDAMLLAERVRGRIERRFEENGAPGITASFGVAGFSQDTPTPHELLEAADSAMYQSKHAGRNCVALSSMPPSDSPESN